MCYREYDQPVFPVFETVSMKKVFLVILVALGSSCVGAQQKSVFIRAFDREGELITWGSLKEVTDSSVILQKGKQLTEVPVQRIGILKLRRSYGHTIFVSAAIQSVIFATLFGIEGAGPDGGFLTPPTVGSGIMGGLVFGTVTGAYMGAVIGIFQKRPVLRVDNHTGKWKQVKDFLNPYLPRQSITTK